VPEASTSRSSFSSRPSLLPPEYFSPPLPLQVSSSLSPSYSGSHHFKSFSPTNYSGENEISPCTAITSTFHHESTPEGPSPTVISMLSYSVYENNSLLYHHHDSDSLLFAPPTTVKDYTWDRLLTSADGYAMVSPRESESEEYQHPAEEVYQHPAEEVYHDSTISEDGELKLNLPACTYP
jgi:hypothetical protein